VKFHDPEGFTTFSDIKVFVIMTGIIKARGLVGLLGWLGLLTVMEPGIPSPSRNSRC
jgi:hypothetical protein